MDKIIYRFQGAGEVTPSNDTYGMAGHQTVDIARMRRAFESPSIQMPLGLTREQKRAYILAHADTHPVKA